MESLKIIHWNGGAKLWKNKIVEIEALLLEQKPDLCFVTEANLWDQSLTHEREIPGHTLILPNTMTTQLHARIVLVVRDGVDVVKLNQFMDNTCATIWVKAGKGKKSLNIGGIYRELRILGQGHRGATWQELQEEQEDRWRMIVENWRKAGSGGKCLAIGDINLDFARWEDPEVCLEKMVERCQDVIENNGFIQLISTITRSWSGQRDSILDHIWVNCPTQVLNHFNLPRGPSDHNVIGVNVSTKQIKIGGQNVLRRKME